MDPGPLRDIFMVTDSFVIILHIEVAILFLLPYWKKPEIRIRLFIGLFFLVMSVAFVILFIERYFQSDPLLVNAYSFTLALSLTLFCGQVEREYRTRIRTRGAFTIACLVTMVLSLIIPSTFEYFFTIAFAIAIIGIFPGIFLLYIVKSTRGQMRNRMIIAFIGTMLTIFGNYGMTYHFGIFLETQFTPDASIGIFVAVRAIILSGLAMIFYGFSVDVFLESDWRKYLAEYYIIENARGICLFSKNYSSAFDTGDDDSKSLFSGGIVGIMAMIQEFTQSNKELNVIDKGKVKILLERGDQVTVVFIVRENMPLLRYLAKQTVQEFENTLGVMLSTNWNGDTEMFRATGVIIDKLFSNY